MSDITTHNTPPTELLHFHYLQWLCAEGWDIRMMPERIEKQAKIKGKPYEEMLLFYRQRLARELKALYKQKFVDYLLIVYDLYRWCREEADIMVGPGRGSSAGSLVCFLSTITSIDPIEHDLLFERFINPNRLDMPDIDMDFEDARREEVIQYLYDRYGHENVSQITTVAQLKGKSCLKDVARVFQVPYEEVNKVTGSIVERSWVTSGPASASRTASKRSRCAGRSMRSILTCCDSLLRWKA